MEAKDLMIGIFAYFNCFDGTRITVKVTGFLDNIVYGVSENGSHWCIIEKVEPIPLTPEILEKNGFEKVLDEDGTECYRYYNSAADGYIKISLYNGGDGDWSIEIVNYEKFDNNEIVYNNNFIFLKVHQLQHALKLCGIDKEIDLNNTENRVI